MRKIIRNDPNLAAELPKVDGLASDIPAVAQPIIPPSGYQTVGINFTFFFVERGAFLVSLLVAGI